MDLAAHIVLGVGGLGAAGLLGAAWVLVVWWIYRPRRPSPIPLAVTAADGWQLALFHRPPATRRFLEPVLLCHGLAANHRHLDFEPPWSLAQHLADAGFECFIVEWRGTGRSRGAPGGRRATDYCIDDHVRLDAPAFLDEALRRAGAKRAFWVGHSLGGLVGYAAAQGPTGVKLAGMVTLGSPAFYRYPPVMQHLMRLGRVLSWPFSLRQRLWSVATAPFLGHVTLPLTDVVMNPVAIPPAVQRRLYAQVISSIGRQVVLQFHDWLTHDAFRSRDGKDDWRAGLARLEVPLLVAGGACDKLAPPDVLEAAFAAAGSSDKTLMVFGTRNGDALDYGHGDLVCGQRAHEEVFPQVRSWLTARATPTESS
jgi:pimeloyl-ACP methyl ester carboxylesterase